MPIKELSPQGAFPATHHGFSALEFCTTVTDVSGYCNPPFLLTPVITEVFHVVYLDFRNIFERNPTESGSDHRHPGAESQ